MVPALAFTDGALGFWQAVEEVWPALLAAQDRQCLEHRRARLEARTTIGYIAAINPELTILHVTELV
jgi:hypothetical protein